MNRFVRPSEGRTMCYTLISATVESRSDLYVTKGAKRGAMFRRLILSWLLLTAFFGSPTNLKNNIKFDKYLNFNANLITFLNIEPFFGYNLV